jgi:hypothetical protein
MVSLWFENIGRGNVGKSAIERAFAKFVVSRFFALGLPLDVENSQQVAELIERNHAIRTRLENDPLFPTTEATPIRYLLCEGEKSRLDRHSQEVIGKVLLNRKPNSPPEWKADYAEYMDRLPAAHVLWVLLPIPEQRTDGRYKCLEPSEL